MSDLTGRVALVSGGGRGIGRAISVRLAQRGATVAVNYRRDAEAAQETCAQITAAGGHVKAYPASVDSVEQVAELAAAVLADVEAVDILVCNAGIASRGQHLVDTSPEEFERLLGTHVLGTANLCRQFVPAMRTRDRGDVVVISSVATEHAIAGGGPYMMAKVAMEAYARTLALEELAHGIHVNIVAPGLVATDMGDRLARAVTGVGSATELDANSPYGRVCRPDDVADVVEYLVSGGSSYLNGQRIAVNGGGSSFGNSY